MVKTHNSIKTILHPDKPTPQPDYSNVMMQFETQGSLVMEKGKVFNDGGYEKVR
jgi:hypothetical protein